VERDTGGKGNWQHNPDIGREFRYRDQGTAQKFNQSLHAGSHSKLVNLFGRAEQGSRDLSKGGAGQPGGRQGGQNRAPETEPGERVQS